MKASAPPARFLQTGLRNFCDLKKGTTALMKSLLLRLARCLAGYVAAVLVSAQVALGLLMATGIPDGGARNISNGASLMVLAVMFTAIFATAPAAIFLIGLEWRHARTFLPYGLAGAATAFLACLLMTGGNPLAMDLDWSFIAVCMAGGVFGGIAHWWLAGRNAGRPEFLRFRRNPL